MNVADMRVMARTTRYVSGLGDSGLGGDPSPHTAAGVLAGIQAAVAERLGLASLDGVRVAVQGLGNVGYRLCELLRAQGAVLLVADLDPVRVARAVDRLAATAVPGEQILSVDADVFAPCAMGGVLTEARVAALGAPVVAGAANNQLASPDVGDLLARRDVLYAPDYVINAGGVISVAQEYLGIRDPAWAGSRIAGIRRRLEAIFQRARSSGEATSRVADAMARERLQQPPPPALRGAA
jgi:leucine dehydrogenase